MMREVLCGDVKEEAPVELQMLACVDATPKTLHPMTQYIIGVLGAQSTSALAAQYREGLLNKDNMWQPVLADGFHLVRVKMY